MSILRASDLNHNALQGLLARRPWPKEAYIWAEWLDRAWLGSTEHLFEEVASHALKDTFHGRVFWEGGELRWKLLDSGVYRTLYLGEDEAFAPKELEDASSEFQREMTRSVAFPLPAHPDENDSDDAVTEDGTEETSEVTQSRERAESYFVELEEFSLCSKDLHEQKNSTNKRLHLKVRMYKNPSGESCFERYAALRWR